ncbi:hypothetical protein I3760_05G255900 [Carya illinoinensis]|uniref:Uncharacterized protein n=1 Tax=Carya illinoinensis TaxID=32201 RepID=A0A8T1QNP8_CARIL|nr:hypothetical protein I3760_05G255900 [Carya illinoinensis]KAG6656045.1 hypothetical protein CIPAW_05G259600 [Carya illinoinensis]
MISLKHIILNGFFIFSLKHLDMGGVNLSLAINWLDTINMLPSLSYSHLSGCELSMPILPMISNATITSPLLGFLMCEGEIIGVVPHRLWKELVVLDLTKFPLLEELNLYCNRLNRSLAKSIGKLFKLQVLDVSSNCLKGVITKSHLWNVSHLPQLGFSFNSPSLIFSPTWIPILHLNTIKLSFCKMGFINFPTLDLSYNFFNGVLPLLHSGAVVLNLSNNFFQGSIKSIFETNGSISNLRRMSYLDLSNNLLSGEVPSHLATMKCLIMKNSNGRTVPNLGNNNLFGGLLESIKNLIEIQKLHLRNNNFIVLDLGENKLSERMHARKSISTLGLLKFFDLSSNRMQGERPRGITCLSGLIGLNLSRNLLTGFIPQNTDGLETLDFLDLSRNHLSSIIPPSLVALSLLSYLNFSNNHLSGSIPIGTQLLGGVGSLSTSKVSLRGNKNLGLPLPKRCLGDKASQALGFIVGFWGVCGSLLLRSSWKHNYFQYLDNMETDSM